jgi:hypothetical protein
MNARNEAQAGPRGGERINYPGMAVYPAANQVCNPFFILTRYGEVNG